MSSSVLEEQQKELPVEQEGHSQAESTSSTSISPQAPDSYIIHPESLQRLTSRPGQISYLSLASKYAVTLDKEVNSEGIVTSTGNPWLSESNDSSSQDPLKIHIEGTFLNSNTLRIRMGLETSFPFPDAYPVDPAFPPSVLRSRLFPPGATTEPIAGDQRDDLVCGLSLRANDGDIWANPRDSGIELRWVAPPFGLHATYQAGEIDGYGKGDDGKDRPEEDMAPTFPHAFYTSANRPKPIFEQAPLGPFTPLLLPSGIMKIGDSLLGTDLLILGKGEKLQSGGPGRHRKDAESQPLATMETEPVPKEARQEFSDHFGGKYLEEKTPMAPPAFLWTDRGWGLLMKDPVMVRMAGLEDGRAMLGLMMLAGEKGMIDYLIVVGDALEACKEEYPVE